MIRKLVPSFLILCIFFSVEVAAAGDEENSLNVPLNRRNRSTNISTNEPQQDSLTENQGKLTKGQVEIIYNYHSSRTNTAEALALMADDDSDSGRAAKRLFNSLEDAKKREEDEKNRKIGRYLTIASTICAATTTAWQAFEFSKDENAIGFVDPFISNVVSVGLAFLTTVTAGVAVYYK